MKERVICILFGIVLTALAACDTGSDDSNPLQAFIKGSVEMIPADNTLDRGTTGYVRLTETGGTPYYWDSVIQDESILELDDDQTFPRSADPLLDGGLIDHVWKFRAIAPGTTTVIFTLKNVSGNTSDATAGYEYTVTVR